MGEVVNKIKAKRNLLIGIICAVGVCLLISILIVNKASVQVIDIVPGESKTIEIKQNKKLKVRVDKKNVYVRTNNPDVATIKKNIIITKNVGYASISIFGTGVQSELNLIVKKNLNDPNPPIEDMNFTDQTMIENTPQQDAYNQEIMTESTVQNIPEQTDVSTEYQDPAQTQIQGQSPSTTQTDWTAQYQDNRQYQTQSEPAMQNEVQESAQTMSSATEIQQTDSSVSQMPAQTDETMNTNDAQVDPSANTQTVSQTEPTATQTDAAVTTPNGTTETQPKQKKETTEKTIELKSYDISDRVWDDKIDLPNLIYIIGAVESGGQVYGNRDYGCYIEPNTNSKKEKTITIGWPQFYGNNARKLLKKIYKTDKDLFLSIDRRKSVKKMLKKNWEKKKWKPNDAQKKIIIELITSKTGKECQDAMFLEEMVEYVKYCKKRFTDNAWAIHMYCEIANLGGEKNARRIFKACKGNYTLDNIMAVLREDQNNKKDNEVGDEIYWDRHEVCCDFLQRNCAEENPTEEKKK